MLDRRLRVLCVASGSSGGTLPRTGHLFGLQSELVSSLLSTSDCDWTGENDNNNIDRLFIMPQLQMKNVLKAQKKSRYMKIFLKPKTFDVRCNQKRKM